MPQSYSRPSWRIFTDGNYFPIREKIVHAFVYCKLCFVGVAIRLEFQFGPHVSGVQLNPQLEVNNKKRGLERGVQYWKKSRFFVRSASNFLDQIVFFTKYKKRKKVEVGQHQLLLQFSFLFTLNWKYWLAFYCYHPSLDFFSTTNSVR